MAVRQYVGARYVPKFYQNSQNPLSSEWEDNKAYEALTVVTYNNSSYTSKIPVPTGIGNPAQNPTYWAATGDYNTQVEQYRQITAEVQDGLNAEITNRENADNELTNKINAEITNRENADNELTNKINEETSAREKTDKTTLFIFGDSWCTVNYDVPGTPLQELPVATTIMQQFYDNVFNYGVAGATINQFNTQVTKAKSEHADIGKCYVLICGGVNSIYKTQNTSQSIINDLNSLYASIYTNFPKAKVFIAPSAAKYRAISNNDNLYGTIIDTSANAGVVPLTQTLLWLMNDDGHWYNTTSTNQEEHAVHLSVEGYRHYFNIVHTLMNGGSLMGRGKYDVRFAAEEHIGTQGQEVRCPLYYNFNNNIAILYLNIQLRNLNEGTTVTLTQSETNPFPIEFGLFEPNNLESNTTWITAGITSGNKLIEASVSRTKITFQPPANTSLVIGAIVMPARNIQRLAYT